MNNLDQQLVYFSYAFATVMAILLVVPVLRRKSDVITSWNFFLIGSFIFTGMSGLNSARVQEYLPSLSASSYHQYYLGVVVFYTAICLVYYKLKFPRKLAGRTLLRWPPVTSTTAPFIAGGLLSLLVGLLAPVSIPVVGQLLFMFSLVAPSIAMTVLTIAWFRDRSNIFLLTLLLLCLPITFGASIAAGGSRRFLISALAAFPVGMYWVWLRYQSTAKILGVFALAGAVTIPVIFGFSAIRHSSREDKSTTTARVKSVLTALPNAIKQGGTSEGFMGQDSVECALSVIELLNNGSRELEVHPFASVWLILTNPIPRSMWEEKPESLGYNLVRHFGLKGTNANLGLNVVGQGYYDGGLVVLLIYALIMGSFLRYYDELLIRQPGNPLLVGGLVAMSSQIIGWPRGCIGIFGMQIIQSVVVVLGAMLLGRLVFGGKVVYPRTDHLVDYPILRSAQDWQRWMRSYTAVTPAARRVAAADDED